jgi:hypothetical protein
MVFNLVLYVRFKLLLHTHTHTQRERESYRSKHESER